MDGAEEEEDDEVLGIEGIDEDEDEELGIDGIEDDDEDEDELGIDGLEDGDDDEEELGIEGIPLLELELCWVDSQLASRPSVRATARDLSEGTDLLMLRSSTVASAQRNG